LSCFIARQPLPVATVKTIHYSIRNCPLNSQNYQRDIKQATDKSMQPWLTIIILMYFFLTHITRPTLIETGVFGLGTSPFATFY